MNIKRSSIGFMILVMVLVICSCNKNSSSIDPSMLTTIPPAQTLTQTPVPTSTLIPTPVSQVTISGTITNLIDAKPYLTEGSFLQLVVVTEGEQITIAYLADGTISLDSDLAQIPIPSDEGFSALELENLHRENT